MAKVVIWLLYQYPEMIMLSFAGPRLLGLKAGLGTFLIKTLVFSMLVPIIREFTPFGLHSLVLILAFIFFIRFLYRVPLPVATLATIISFFLLALGDGMIIPAVLKAANLTGISPVFSRPLTHVIFGYLSSSFLLVGCIAALSGYRLLSISEGKGASTK